MIDRLKFLLLVNWHEEGEWDLYRALKARVACLDVLGPLSGRPGWGKSLLKALNRFCELYLPLLACMRGKQYDLIVAWGMRMGILYGIFTRFFCFSARPRLMVYDFHINMVRCDLRYRIKLFFLNLAIPAIDYFLCTSSREEELYSQIFSIPRSRLRFLPIAEYDPVFLDKHDFPVQDYIFSYGNSDRDFDTLIAAAGSLNMQVVLLSQAYAPKRSLPGKVRVISERIDKHELIRYIASARMVVLPMLAFEIAAGQQAMFEVMALGRPLVVTANTATVEYAEHGRTALFYTAGGEQELAGHIRSLRDDPAFAEAMGRNAQKSMQAYPQYEAAGFMYLLDYFISSPGQH